MNDLSYIYRIRNEKLGFYMSKVRIEIVISKLIKLSSNGKILGFFIHVILFWTQIKFKFIAKLDFMFKLYSFFCRTSSSLFTCYLINLFFFIYIKLHA